MSGRTFSILVLSGFFSLMVSMRIENRAMSVFSLALMWLPAMAVVKQNEIK